MPAAPVPPHRKVYQYCCQVSPVELRDAGGAGAAAQECDAHVILACQRLELLEDASPLLQIS